MMRVGRLAGSTALICATFGCSDPVPPAAKGAANINVTNAATGSCGIRHNTIIPRDALVTTSDVGGDRVVNGEKGAKVRCSRSGSTFSAEIAQEGRSITFTGVLGDAPTQGNSVSHFDPAASQSMRSAGAGCAMTTIDTTDDGLWVSFSCPEFNAPPTHACSATGVFVFENCD